MAFPKLKWPLQLNSPADSRELLLLPGQVICSVIYLSARLVLPKASVALLRCRMMAGGSGCSPEPGTVRGIGVTITTERCDREGSRHCPAEQRGCPRANPASEAAWGAKQTPARQKLNRAGSLVTCKAGARTCSILCWFWVFFLQCAKKAEGGLAETFSHVFCFSLPGLLHLHGAAWWARHLGESPQRVRTKKHPHSRVTPRSQFTSPSWEC